MKLLILNGPNLNMLGIREPEIYGNKTYQDLVNMIENYQNEIIVEIKQSNYEGELVTWIQEAYFQNFDGIIINPGAYTHTSIAILDALKSTGIRTIEVHISNLDKREEFRKISYISSYAEKRIIGHGLEGYLEAIDYFRGNKRWLLH